MAAMGRFSVLLALLAIVQFANGTSLEEDPFIVGGIPSDIALHPHHLALFDMVRGGPGNYMCGASNIHRYWALTAAHCVDFGTPASLVHLWGGSTSRTTGGHLFFVSAYHLHPGYDRQSIDLDIAILEVDPGTPLAGFPYVTPIRISALCATNCCDVCPEGSPITVAGWGRVEDGTLPDLLREVDKDIIDLGLCNEYWHNHPGGVSHSKFCTRVEDGRDSCNGDSGSSIVRNGVQVGLVSFGSLVCGDGTLPAVYLRLEEPTIRNWIHGYVQVS